MNNSTGTRSASVSPSQLTEHLQILLNDTASAQNYELESKTVSTYKLLEQIREGLPEDESRLSNYYLLFNAWIRWISDWHNYSLNLLHRRRLLGHLNRELGQGRFILQIYPYSNRLYSISFRGSKPVIQLHEALDYMNEEQCRRFGRYMRSRSMTDMKRLLQEYHAGSAQSKELLAFFQETRTRPVHADNTRGRFFDLEEVFNSCNRRNFGGKIPRPKAIFWSPKVNHSTMGSYNVQEDCVMINRGLDCSWVPAYVLDFVMYHELLHKVLGIKTSGTRRMAHTREFRRLEQAHPDYEKAQAFIRNNAKKL